MIFKDEKLIQLCEFDEQGEIRFTKELLDATKDFTEIRKFASQLISHWGLEYIRLLDYFGPDDAKEDKFSCIDGEPMDIRDDIPDLYSYKELAAPGLDGEWYRDIMRAKLVSIKLPERLIKEYIKAVKKTFD